MQDTSQVETTQKAAAPKAGIVPADYRRESPFAARPAVFSRSSADVGRYLKAFR